MGQRNSNLGFLASIDKTLTGQIISVSKSKPGVNGSRGMTIKKGYFVLNKEGIKKIQSSLVAEQAFAEVVEIELKYKKYSGTLYFMEGKLAKNIECFLSNKPRIEIEKPIYLTADDIVPVKFSAELDNVYDGHT